MAGSGTKGGCTVNLININKKKAPAEMYDKKNFKKKKIKKEEIKKKNQKRVHTFSNRSLRCSWRSTVGYIFLQKEKIVLFLS